MSTDIHSPNNIDKIVEHISDLLRMLIAREGSGAHLHGFVNVCLNLTNAFRDDLRATCPLNVCLVTLMAGATSMASDHRDLFSCCSQLLTDHTPCDGLRLWILGSPQNWSIPSPHSNHLCTEYDYTVAQDNTNATIYCVHQPRRQWSENWITAFTIILCLLTLVGVCGNILSATIVLHYRTRWKQGNLLLLLIVAVCDVTAPLVLIPLATIDLLSPSDERTKRTCILEAMTYMATIFTSITVLLLAIGSFFRVIQSRNKCLTAFQKLSAITIIVTTIVVVTRVAMNIKSTQCGENLSTETLSLFSSCGVLALLCCSYVLYYEAILSHCTSTAENTKKIQNQQTSEAANYDNHTTNTHLLKVPIPKAQLPPLEPITTPQANGHDESTEKELAELFSGPTIRTATTKVVTSSPQLKRMLTNQTEHRLNVLQIDDDSIVTDTSANDNKQEPQPIKQMTLVNTQMIIAFIFTFAIGNLPPLLNDHIHTVHKSTLANNYNQYHTILWCFSYAVRCLNPWMVIAKHHKLCKEVYNKLHKACQHRVRHHHDPS